MILADKIVRLRKKNGWSQEELAQKMNVSRQAVSKWESAQTIPELENMIRQSGFRPVRRNAVFETMSPAPPGKSSHAEARS